MVIIIIIIGSVLISPVLNQYQKTVSAWRFKNDPSFLTVNLYLLSIVPNTCGSAGVTLESVTLLSHITRAVGLKYPPLWRGCPDEPALTQIRSKMESHLIHTCPETDDKALRLMLALESTEFHERRRVSGTLEASQLHSTHAHIWTLMWIICRVTQSTPRPHSAGGASESLPLCQALEPFLALRQHRRRWKKGGRTVTHSQCCLPTPPSTCKELPFPTSTTFACTQKPQTLQTKCCRLSVCSIIHPSVKTAIITVKKEFLTIIFPFDKGKPQRLCQTFQRRALSALSKLSSVSHSIFEAVLWLESAWVIAIYILLVNIIKNEVLLEANPICPGLLSTL